MKLFLAICCLSVVYGAPASDQNVQILRFDNNIDETGNYNFAFELSDGTKRNEESRIVNAGDPEKESIVVTGEYEYIGLDGVTYRVTYTADENGFHPYGKHLPGQPEISGGSGGFTSGGFAPGLIASLLGG